MKESLLGFIFVCLLGPQVQAQDACSLAFTSKLQEADFQIMFSRDAHPVEGAYKTNMKLVARNFELWLHGSEERAFTEFLGTQHKTAVLGDETGTVYWPKSYVDVNYAKSFGGLYRHHTLTLTTPGLLIHHHELNPQMKAEILIRRGNQTKVTEMNSGILTSVNVPQVEGIPTEALPKYHFDRNTAVYSYPAPKQIPLYLEAMSEALNTVRLNVSSQAEAESVLKPLARYYHLAMIGHPFIRVNNSLIMAQVNVVLKTIGLKPVYHGDLDYLIRSLDSPQAERAFIEYVYKKQN